MFYGKIIKQNLVGCKTINVCLSLKVLNDKAEFFADERQFYRRKNNWHEYQLNELVSHD